MKENVTPKQRIAIESLIKYGDKRKACLAVDISHTTLYRWMKKPDFIKALRSAEKEAMVALNRSLIQLGEEALLTLKEVLQDSSSKSVKVRAADIVLSRLLQFRTLIDIEERLSRLENVWDDKNLDLRAFQDVR